MQDGEKAWFEPGEGMFVSVLERKHRVTALQLKTLDHWLRRTERDLEANSYAERELEPGGCSEGAQRDYIRGDPWTTSSDAEAAQINGTETANKMLLYRRGVDGGCARGWQGAPPNHSCSCLALMLRGMSVDSRLL